jgi:hypothetical protein
MGQANARPHSKQKLSIAALVALVAALVLYLFVRGPVDTTKDYYDDSEAPEYQVRIRSGVETRVPWAEVPEDSRYFTSFEADSVLPTQRIPIVKIEVTTFDENGKPDDRESPYGIVTVETGLNPRHVRHARGGYGAR